MKRESEKEFRRSPEQNPGSEDPGYKIRGAT
jgi:hypothetical protein